MEPSTSRIETRAVHGGMDGLEQTGSHVPTIDFSTTNPLPNVELGGDSYEHLATGGTLLSGQSAVYQRLWQPGVARFEESLAGLESSETAVAFATGMAALTACLIASVSGGKPHMVGLRPLYGGTDHVLDNGLVGTTVTWAHAENEIAGAIQADTGLIIIETPANPTLELVDIARVVEAAGDIPVLVDNTFSTPVLQRPIELGATLSLHSATKYIGGHGDV
ncbi:MAG: PLP-dependent transferase, partial [Terrimesophilobacter sp.]